MVVDWCASELRPGLNRLARRLNIDCVAAMVAWEFHSGFSHPMCVMLLQLTKQLLLYCVPTHITRPVIHLVLTDLVYRECYKHLQ